MYPILDITIPLEKRREINSKILHIVDSGQMHPQITPSIIFSSYSPLGSFHGLEFSDYNSFYEFQQAKKEVHFGQYFTPLIVSKFMSLMFKIPKESKVADLTAGTGSLINFLQVPSQNIYCNEWEIKSYKVLKYLFPDVNHSNKDIREYKTDTLMDCILGNAPFGLTWRHDKTTYNSEVFYLLKSFQLLKPAGLCAVIVPESFLVDDFKDKGNINLINKHFNFVAQFILPTNIFESVGAKITTKIMVFTKKSEHIKDNPYINGQHNRIELESLDHKTATYYYKEYIKPLYEQKESVKGKLILEAIQHGSKKNGDFEYKVKKMLFDIKRGKNTKEHYNRAEAYLLRFQTQEKPSDMDYIEWCKIQITENKVLSYLKRILKDQHKPEGENKIKLVKNRYGLSLKGYNRKAVLSLGKLNTVKEMSFNDMLLNNEYPFEDETYKPLFEKKRKEWERQSQSFKDMKEDEYIKQWLDNFTITDHTNDRLIKLNAIQKHDVNLLLQKKYGYLQWQQGSGKSLASLAIIQYRLEHNHIRNAFIIAPAIAIKNTFNVILDDYKLDYIMINKLSDIENIKRGQIVIMTFGMLNKYQKQIKQYIKKQSQKVLLILDEADSVASLESKRSRSVLSVFSHCRYKNLCSGTSTRNTLAEAFSQLHLMYQSSINFISEAETIFVENNKTKEIERKENNLYMKPFPPFKKGQTHFKRCFIPEKVTVFGITRTDQSIYSSDKLKKLIDKSFITRTFEEITQKQLYKIIQNTCTFSNDEKDLYKVILDEFYKIAGMFGSTGNTRKDAILKLIKQLNALMLSTSLPIAFKEYKGDRIPSKAKKMLEMLKEWDSEIVSIGCTRIKTVNAYANIIRNAFPDRPLFIITGESSTLEQRKRIIEQLKETKNGILLCTQQSLSSSMSIDYVNRVLLVELNWNMSSLSQHFFRFIRYTSTEPKEIHFLTVKNSIDSNVLSLIANKEKLNLFMKDEDIDTEELNDRLGINYDLLSMLLEKSVDNEGKSYIKWNEQTIQ